MKVVLHNEAKKVYNKTNEPDKSRLRKALAELSKEPPEGDIKKLEGQKDKYRVRFGGWRIIFEIDRDYIDPETKKKGAVVVTEIGTRGGVYKGA